MGLVDTAITGVGAPFAFLGTETILLNGGGRLKKSGQPLAFLMASSDTLMDAGALFVKKKCHQR